MEDDSVVAYRYILSSNLLVQYSFHNHGAGKAAAFWTIIGTTVLIL